MCAKDDLIRRKSLLSTSTQTWEVLFQTHDRQLAGELATAESVTAKDLLNRVTVVLIIISVNKTQLSLILEDRSTPSTLLARFIPITKIRNPLLKTLENAAKSRILLACADRRIRQCYPTICAILADYEEQVLLTSVKKNRYCTRYTLIAVVSLLFVLKAPFALHFIRAVCDLVTLAQYKSYDEDTLAYIQGALERMNVFKEEFQVYRRTLGEEKNFNYPKALDSICTRANSEAHYITIVKQFYSITNKKEYILQICLHNSQRTALLAANYATIVKQSQPSTTINIQDCTYSTRLYLILIIIDYTCYDKDRKHIAYIRAFSKVLLFNNNRQINNTTRMLSFYDLSTIIRLVHLVPRDLPNLTTHKYNCLYLLTFNIDLLRTLQEYQQK
ncbi:hypothetical protein HBH49_201640 [Parastagonospora nodorum]|nr:hypothetical protein HBH49_201640 [Parastagonospora nodorum]